ncbi:MAG: hypothetical protein ACYS30_18785 [Planctomycetota bacterium]|jgi:hypothetical protein
MLLLRYPDGGYYHVIFTLPHELRAFVRRHQQEVYGLLIKCAADSILTLAADPHYVGGLVAYGVPRIVRTCPKYNRS